MVLVVLAAMDDGRHHRPVRRAIASQLVFDQPPRLAALPLQQFAEDAFGGSSITARLDENIDHVTILINGTPEILTPTLDRDEDLVQVPSITEATLPTLQATSVLRTKLEAPKPDRFVGNRDESTTRSASIELRGASSLRPQPSALRENRTRAAYGPSIGSHTPTSKSPAFHRDASDRRERARPLSLGSDPNRPPSSRARSGPAIPRLAYRFSVARAASTIATPVRQRRGSQQPLPAGVHEGVERLAITRFRSLD